MNFETNEEILKENESIFVEFLGRIDSQLFTNNSNNIRFYGLDTNEPILQICGNNTFFCGHFEHIFGTNVLFEIKDKIGVKTEDNQNNSNNNNNNNNNNN
jgi:hypothetical protein